MRLHMHLYLNTVIFLFVLWFCPFKIAAQQSNYLIECWNKQVKPLNKQLLKLTFQENLNELEHNFEPWQQTNYDGKGIVWLDGNDFYKNDTLVNVIENRTYYSKTQYTKSELLFLDYGDKNLFPVTQSMCFDQIFKSSRYSPINLINYFVKNKIPEEKVKDDYFAIYQTKIYKTIIKLFIRKSDNLLLKITTLSDDELFGDVLNTYIYNDYKSENNLFYPKIIQIEKINGKVKDIIKIVSINIVKDVPKLLNKPSDYKLKEDINVTPEIKVEKYSNNIYFLELKHTDDKVVVVEFSDFLLVAEAPLNSKNGELIIQEAKKIAPNKPIKYFVFGHFHPHYIGGIRPFIQKKSKILCIKANEDYVKYIADAAHTLNPDSLQINPKPLQVDIIENSKIISDGKFEMKIYFIGKKSHHTNDYLIYYFPTEKLLFEDDLVWINKVGEIGKAGERQAGLYNSIKELGIDVTTIIQSWPVSDYGVKTIIPFQDLEKSMNIK